MNNDSSHSGPGSGRTVICRSCAAEFSADLPNCPYCGTMYLPAAEKAYMNRLEGMRGDLHQLGDLAGRKARTRVRTLYRRMLVVGAILLLLAAAGYGVHLHRARVQAAADRAEYLWQREAFAQMDALYDAGDYAALLDAYCEATDAGHKLYSYRHYDFCDYLLRLDLARGSLNWVQNNGSDLDQLFYDELTLYRLEGMTRLTDEERQILTELRAPLLADFEARFPLSEQETEAFRQKLRQDGYLSCSETEQFLREKGWIP